MSYLQNERVVSMSNPGTKGVVVDSGSVGSTDGRGAARAEHAQGTPTQSNLFSSILVGIQR